MATLHEVEAQAQVLGADEEMYEVSTEEFIAVNKRRAASYGFLARLYRVEIDEPLLEELRGMRFPANTGNAEVDNAYRLMAQYLSNTWKNSVTDLAVDFVRTFIGHGTDAFSAAYPYESVYTSEKRLLMQGARDEVLSIYRSMGLDKHADWKESEDHLATELEFIQILIYRAIEALEQGDTDGAFALMLVQKNFMEDHLASWVPMMTADMLRFAKTDLYQGVAHLTNGFLETDRAFLEEVLLEEEM